MARKKPWLRHPARDITEPRTCPTGKTRFASTALAQQALPFLMAPHMNIVACEECKGAHHEPLTPEGAL